MFQIRISGGLDADQDKIDGTDLLRGSASADRVLMKIPKRAADLDAMLLKVGEIPAGQESDGHTGFGQFGAVVHAESSGSDHGDFG